MRYLRGVALLSALLVAAVVASIAALLVTRAQYATAAASQFQQHDLSLRLAQALELQAFQALRQDVKTGLAGQKTDDLSTLRFVATQDGVTARGDLRDLQGLFNLTNLAFDPAQSGAQSARSVNRGHIAELSDGESGPAANALRSVAAAAGVDLGDGAPKAGQVMPPLAEHQIAIARFVLLLKALDIDPVIVPAILDWLDADDEPRFPNGAEDDYYSRLKPPYRTANHRFAEPSELLRVRGITPAIYEKLRPFVICLDQVTGINVNTAPVEVLMSLSPALDRATAEQLIKARDAQPWLQPELFRQHPALAALPPLLTGLATQSSTFELHARVELPDSPVFFRSTLRRNGFSELRLLGRERRYDPD